MKPTVHNQPSAEPGRTKSSNDGAVQRFRTTKRLTAEDQRTAAINLGKLAASLNPDNPAKAAKQIVAESKLDGVFDKRKRFFRLPNEDAPIAAKDGTYNANPEKFLTLARAAGRLLCGSSDKSLQEKEEARAQRTLLLGTSFLPVYMPETQAEKSVKALLDEYAVRLAEAIEQRTRIVELWKALETTPISLEASEESLPPSIYGVSADFPAQLLQPLYRDYIKFGQLQPASFVVSESWPEPTLLLGHLMISYDLYALIIPEERNDLFPDTWEEFELCAADRNSWLESIGFDVINHGFRDDNEGCDQDKLRKVVVGFIYKVGLKVRRGHRDQVEIELNIWESIRDFGWYTDFLVSGLHAPGGRSRANSELQSNLRRYMDEEDYERMVRRVTIGPVFNEENEEEYPFEAYCEEYGGNCFLANSRHYTQDKPTKILLLRDCFNPEYWEDEGDCEEYGELTQAKGWVDDANCARLLTGASNITFVPSIKEADPVAGAARAGSIAASILGNAMSASPESRISHILIDRVAMTAEAGLKFYDALIDTTRSALINI